MRICDMSRIRMIHVTHLQMPLLSQIRMRCAMTHAYLWHDSLTSVISRAQYHKQKETYIICKRAQYHEQKETCIICNSSTSVLHLWECRIRICSIYDITCWCVCHDPYVSVTWLVGMCAMTHSYLWHDSLMCVPWLEANSSPFRMPVMSQTRIRCAMTHAYLWHVTNTNESCHTFANASFVCVRWLGDTCAMTHAYVWHDSLICGLRFPDSHEGRIRIYDMTRGHVCHDSYMSVTCLVDTCAMTHSLVTWLFDVCAMTQANGTPLRMRVSSPIRMRCAMTHAYLWHDPLTCVPWRIDSFVCVPWLIRMCAMTHSYVGHDSLICLPWLIRMCDMTRLHVCHDSLTHSYAILWKGTNNRHVSHNDELLRIWCFVTAPCNGPLMNESCHSYEWVTAYMLTSHVTRNDESLRMWCFATAQWLMW